MTQARIIDPQEYIDLEAHKPSGRPDYHFDSSAFSRRLLFYHGFLLMKHIEDRAESVQPLNTPEMEIKNFPELREEDDCIARAQSILQRLQRLRKEKNLEITEAGDIITACYQEYKAKVWLILFFVVGASLSMLSMIFSLQLMLGEVLSFSGESTKTKLYLLTTLTIFLSTLMDFCDQNLYYENLSLLIRAKQPFILLFYAKTMGLTSYNIKNQNIEKLVNSISSDFNIISQSFGNLLLSIRTPIKFIGITIFLIIQLKWVGVISALIMLGAIPVYYCIGKKTGAIMSQVSSFKDQRIKFYTQIIEGIKFIKIYGWQIAFKHIIQTLRNEEIKGYLKFYFFNSISQGFAQVSVLFSGYISYLIVYVTGQDHLLSTVTLLATIQAINNLKVPMYEISISIPSYFTLLSVFERFAQILSIKRLQMKQLENHDEKSWPMRKKQNAIELQNFYAYWKSDRNEQKEPTLKNISISLKKNGFYGITGKVGSGKSTFFHIFLQQLPFYKGSYHIQGKVAYVQQEPVLFSETVQMNILMGSKFNKRKYEQVLDKSCFTSDLEDLENGDQTLIGERGTKLSGGQRVRLSLARALYSDAEILLLDDPIAALDSKVSKSVFEKSILPLKGLKTILLITHQFNFLLKCDKVILVEEGQIKAFEKPQKLPLSNQNMMNFDKDQEKQVSKKTIEVETEEIVELRQSMERKQNANLDIFTYCRYFFYSKLNWILFPLTILLFILVQTLTVIYFSILSTYDKLAKGEHTILEDMNSFWIFLGIIQICYFFLIPITFLLLNFVVFNSNSAIHESMVKKLIRSPLFYFDVIPSNQLLNRFSNDLTVLDTLIPYSFKVVFERSAAILVSLVTVSSLNLSFVIVLILGVLVCLWFVMKYKNKMVYSKKVHLMTKDPIFKDFTEGVSGNLQLRIAGQCKPRIKEFATKLNRQFQAMFEGNLLSRSLGMALSYICLLFIFVGLLLGAYFLDEDQANFFGVQIILLIQLNSSTQYLLRQVINNQTYIVSAQRALHVTTFESQGQLKTQYDKEHEIKVNYDIDNQDDEPLNPFTALKLWPDNPSLSVEKLEMRYRKQLPLVLKGVSFTIKGGERVGIVGRTGAGKSSIFQALLRMTQPEVQSGYHIGNYDAMKMGLHSLRRNISVIPQTPFILNDNIRRNLDPFQRKSDKELWEVLQKVSLKEKILRTKEHLDTKISGSQFFSVGEKQLFCLARVLLYPNKILILDEATSNVDLKTDSLIQQCIKQKFKYSSVLAIAHRLDTIADYDKILVMERGKVVEAGSPWGLVSRKGLFWEMIQHTGSNSASIYHKIQEAHRSRSFVV